MSFTPQFDNTTTGSITTQNLNPNSGTATAGSSVAIAINNNQAVQVIVSGTYTGDLTFQGTIDGTNWYSITCLPRSNTRNYYQGSIYSGNTGVYTCTASGFTQVRLSALGAVTGTASISMVATQSPVRVFTHDSVKNTYMIGFNNLVVAAGATDIFTITGSASRIIKIIEIELQGTSAAATVINVNVVKRSTLNTGGTSTTLTPVPLNSSSPASTATVKTYTANPTLGTSLGIISTKKYNVNINTATPDSFEQEYTYLSAELPTLNNANESICVNFAGATLTTPSFDGYIIFTEE